MIDVRDDAVAHPEAYTVTPGVAGAGQIDTEWHIGAADHFLNRTAGARHEAAVASEHEHDGGQTLGVRPWISDGAANHQVIAVAIVGEGHQLDRAIDDRS